MTDEQLRELLVQAGWRCIYTYQDNTEEWTGGSGSDGPRLDDVRSLVSLATVRAKDYNQALLRENIRLQAELLTLREKAANLAAGIELVRATLDEK